MARFILKRLLGLIPTLFVIVTLSFIIMKMAPGGPFSSEKNLPPEILANIEKKYHLDEPWPMQYLRYLNDLVHLDLGPSFRYKDYDCNALIGAALPVSLTLGGLTVLVAVILGLTVGIVAALRQNRWPDYVLMSVAVLGISIPMFVIGPVFMLIFAMQLHWLPTSGWLDSRAGLLAAVLPVATLAVGQFAYISRLSRASIIETLRSDYVRTARAKGLKESTVVVRHVLKGALLPVVSFLGPASADILTGSVVVESVFLVPGVGKLFVQAALNRDYTLILAGVLVYSIILLLLNFIVDVVYGFLDPRISYK
jgi:oligopeptide transport system permease protein